MVHLRLPSLLQAVLFAALAAVPSVLAVSDLQDPSATSLLRQAQPDDSFTLGHAVVVGEASAEVQAAFDREESGTAGSAFRKLLHGGHKGTAVGRGKFPPCPRCRFLRSSGAGSRVGHCTRVVGAKDKRKRVFTCAARLSTPSFTKTPKKA